MKDLAYGFYGIVNGNLARKLEGEIKEYFGMKHVFLVSSGKAALFLILTGLKKLSMKKKVVIPAYTCYSVPSAIRMAGLTIVPCDILPETLDYDFTDLASLIDDDTLCILSTHLFGIPSDISMIRSLCLHKDVFIIEDVAQAMGAFSGKSKLGTFGDAGFFSFGRGKNVTCGSGGAIITSADLIANSIRGHYSEAKPVSLFEYCRDVVETIFMTIFLHPSLYWFPKGLPFLGIGETRFYPTFPVHKLSGWKAGLLHNWRQKLERFNRCRVKNARHYLRSVPVVDRVSVDSQDLPYLRFPIYAKSKSMKEKLCKKGGCLGISPMYPGPVHRIREIRGEFPNARYAHSETISDTLVALPTHSLLKEKDMVQITETVRSCA